MVSCEDSTAAVSSQSNYMAIQSATSISGETSGSRTIGWWEINLRADVLHYANESIPEGLLESIRANGILEPLTVRFNKTIGQPGQPYEIIDGRARFACACHLKIREIPVNVVQISEGEAFSLLWGRRTAYILDRIFGLNPAHLDRPSRNLYEVAIRIARREDRVDEWRLYLKAKYLDELVRGCRSKSHLKKAGCLDLDGFMNSMKWWTEVLGLAVQGHPEPGPSSDKAYEWMDRAYMHLAAFIRVYHTDRDRSQQSLELLICYRAFTRQVCTFAQEAWPDENLQKLFDQV